MDERSLIAEAVDLMRGTQPHPNPRVGALVLDASGAVVGRGAHHRRGRPHAEVLALGEAGDRARGGTVVVTLEPCAHTATTPPCADAIVAAGVARVVVGTGDPDGRVSGKGIARLREAGIAVSTDVAPDLVEAADAGYFHHRRTGRPRITLKLAVTLDGQVAAADGTSQWITGAEARHDAHLLRADSDAVVVGAGTLLADDPRLTVRIDGYEGRQPRPVVVAGERPLPPERVLWGRAPLVYAPAPSEVGGEVVAVGGGGRVDLKAMVDDLGKREYVDVLVEGGATLAGELWRARLVDRLVVYIAGVVGGGVGLPALGGVFGSIGDARPVRFVRVDRLGSDVRIDAEVV
ncbi:MAG TPA: bifunctional diaminohydroxyphosphoribosylaminopyrimidine deaminase/5-amino-6-(5-phosphoribosylamino)uracil reductase RibD [Acidimicrobiia bacterium]|nr:bifunctional diaminohydroxyphosphoribosylaminopyrimidine deaminase/5-amino-6-(5-phosphoribosylamino)uracil reductase RibD [Acidimicrobiia bacterium]